MKLSLAIPLALIVLIIAGIYGWQQSDDVTPDSDKADPVSELPDFARYQDVATKKQEFFEFLLPKIQTANSAELARRAWLKELDPTNLSEAEETKLAEMAKRYRVKTKDKRPPQIITELMSRADLVPASLILAQGANESAWGTSRFARDGNNLFGIWCFTRGCGIKPRRRDRDAIHEVESFDTIQSGVNKYIKTINSHPAYQLLREKRRVLRNNNEPLTGISLAVGLEKYSERGSEYVAEIQSMISYNELEQYNRKL